MPTTAVQGDIDCILSFWPFTDVLLTQYILSVLPPEVKIGKITRLGLEPVSSVVKWVKTSALESRKSWVRVPTRVIFPIFTWVVTH